MRALLTLRIDARNTFPTIALSHAFDQEAFARELAQWQSYVRSTLRERLSAWGKKCWEWEQQARNHPYQFDVEQYQALRESDFPFIRKDARWLDRYTQLKQFCDDHGHCLVTRRWPQASLFHWVSVQRSYRKNGKLSIGREIKLNKLGFCWDVNQAFWEQKLAELTQFKRKHGHVRIPQQGRYQRLAHWMENVRSSHRKMTTIQKAQLNQIGFIWKPVSARWEASLRELESFVREHGHANIPARSEKFPRAAAMLAAQRELYRKNKINPQKREQLERLGVHWNFHRSDEEEL